MKAGLTREEWAAEVARQNTEKADYMMRASRLVVEAFGAQYFLHLMNHNGTDQVEPLEIGAVVHRQLGTYLGIPAKYYNRMMAEAPALLVHNLNYWLSEDNAERMIRTLDGTARAFLSNRYRRIDNYEIASAVLPIIGEAEQARFESCHLTSTHMYIKVVDPTLQAEIAPGNVVQAGVAIVNSEVGVSSLSVRPLLYWPEDGTGIIVNSTGMRRTHVGRTIVTAGELLADNTLSSRDRSFLLIVQDNVRSAMDETQFQGLVTAIREARDAHIREANVSGVVKQTAREFGITEDESGAVLLQLSASNDMTRYGLANAVARQSQEVESYDRASDLEAISYDVMTMDAAQWNRINQAV